MASLKCVTIGSGDGLSGHKDIIYTNHNQLSREHKESQRIKI